MSHETLTKIREKAITVAHRNNFEYQSYGIGYSLVYKMLDFIKATFANTPKVEVESYQELTSDFCQKKSARFLLRGLRNGTDFDYEATIAMLNKDIGDGLETILLIADAKFNYFSSTNVREIMKGGKDVSLFLPEAIMKLL
jgi:pantetheine-phosphate adenylyltransferase